MGVSALEYSLRSYEMMKKLHKIKDSLDLADSMLNLGLSYLKMGKKEMGFQYLNGSLAMSVKSVRDKDDFRVAGLLSEIGRAYLVVSLTNVGLDYEKLNENSKGFECKMRGLEMRRRLGIVNEPKKSLICSKSKKKYASNICLVM
jgi:hypothetical protein